MAMEEITHADLKRKLDQVLGEEYGKKLMGYLPGAEVATKEDLNHLRELMDERFRSMDERFDAKLQGMEGRLRAELHKELSGMLSVLTEMAVGFGEQIAAQTRNYIFAMVGAMIALATASRFL